MLSMLSRATIVGLASVVVAALAMGCSNDNSVGPTSLNNNATLQTSSGTTETGAPRSASGQLRRPCTGYSTR
jgi:hypothetical protein